MNTEHLDHPPTPEELAGIYIRSAENDPSSISYKRTLRRPKFPLWRLLILFALFAALTAGVWAALALLPWHPVLPPLGALFCDLVLGLLLARPIVVTLVTAYQAVAPKSVRERCRFEPSCSEYMLLAIEKYGFWKGFAKGLRRWKRCKPPNGGYDLP